MLAHFKYTLIGKCKKLNKNKKLYLKRRKHNKINKFISTRVKKGDGQNRAALFENMPKTELHNLYINNLNR